MSRATQSILFALLFLLSAELGIRRVSSEPENSWAVQAPLETPLVFLLGSSRSERALLPRQLESTLAKSGIQDAWVAGVHEHGVTNAGLLQKYVEVLRPILRGARPERALIGIEVRPSALNDHHVRARERAFLLSHSASTESDKTELAARSSAPPASGIGYLDLLGQAEVESAAQALLWSVHLARGRNELYPLLQRKLRHLFSAMPTTEAPGGELTARLARVYPEWASGDKGWIPFTEEPRHVNTKMRAIRQRHENVLLKDYATGGVQLDSLRRLVREIRADGGEPFFYTLPVTQVFRRLFEPGDYPSAIELIGEAAGGERIPWFDLDTGHDLPLRAFHDMHHLHRSRVKSFSTRFARDVLATLIDRESD